MAGGNTLDDYGKKMDDRYDPKEYLDSRHLKFQTSPVMNSCGDVGYGFQFWKMQVMLCHDWTGSQDTVCFPEQDMVITMNSDTQGFRMEVIMILNLIRTESSNSYPISRFLN